MSTFGKPNYIPDEFLTATNRGWIDNRSGELLVSVSRLTERLAALEPVVEAKAEEPIDEAVSAIIEEEVKVIEKPAPKAQPARPTRPRKEKVTPKAE